ncbi:unnamed protein product [Aphanomyces euteiches]|nr:hypothetical protein AeRB84_000379 [Aphanomyces euteiches]
MMATSKENTPHVQRKLTFQGLSIKQEEAQFNANRVVSSRPDAMKNPTPISSKKTSSSKRRALGDISNNTSASLDKKAQPAFRTPLKSTDGTSQSSSKNVEASAAVELASKLSLKVHSEDDIENAYGGLPESDNMLHLEDLQKQVDLEILDWQKEVDQAMALKKDDFDSLHDGVCEFQPLVIVDELSSPDEIHDDERLEVPPLFNEGSIEFDIID